jgi:predicted alpha/beta superfamily hydrolase
MIKHLNSFLILPSFKNTALNYNHNNRIYRTSIIMRKNNDNNNKKYFILFLLLEITRFYFNLF